MAMSHSGRASIAWILIYAETFLHLVHFLQDHLVHFASVTGMASCDAKPTTLEKERGAEAL